MDPDPEATDGLSFAALFSPGCWVAAQYCLHFSIHSFGNTMPASWHALIPSAAYWQLELSLRCPGPSFFLVSLILFFTSGFPLGSETSTGFAFPPADATSFFGTLYGTSLTKAVGSP